MALGSLGSVYFDIVANDRVGEGTISAQQKLMAVGAVMSGVGLASIAMTKAVTSSFLEFDTAMTNVEAVALSSGAITQVEFDKMRDAAVDFSKQMPITATDFANAMYLMTSVGYDYNQVMAAIPVSAQLAVAGQMSMAESTNAMINVMGAYKETMTDSEEVAKIFANAVALGKFEMSDFMEEVMKNISVASQLGIGWAELAAYNVALQNSFTDASTAGTALNSMLTTMTTTGAKTFAKLGVPLTDTSGKFRDLTDILADTKVALDGVSNEQERMNYLQKMFGTYGARAAIPLMEQVKTLPELTETMANANYMTGQYTVQVDSLASRQEIANNKFEAARIKLGEGMVPALEASAEAVGWLADALEELPEPLQTVAGLGIYAGQGLAAIGPALVAIAMAKGTVGGVLASVSASLSSLGSSAATVATSAGGMIGGGIGAGIALGLAGTWVMVKTGIMDAIGDIGRSLEGAAPGIFSSAKFTFAPIGVAGAMILDTVKGDFAKMPEDVFNVVRDGFTAMVAYVDNFKQAFMGIGPALTGGVSSLGGAVQGMISSFSGIGAIGGYASAAFGNIGGAFNAMAGQVRGVFSQMFNGILGMINSTAAGFRAAGMNIITSIVNGIVAAAGGIVTAIANALNSVRALFPFSPAKEGPLAETPNWGTWMSAGMEAAGPEVAAAASTNLAAPAAAGVAGGMAAGGGPGGSSGGGGDTFTFNVTINGANKATPEMADELFRIFAMKTRDLRMARGLRS